MPDKSGTNCNEDLMADLISDNNDDFLDKRPKKVQKLNLFL
jgi:hypothetical protein